MSVAAADTMKNEKMSLCSTKPTNGSEQEKRIYDTFEKSRRQNALIIKNDNTWEPSVVKFHFISKQDMQAEKSLNPDMEGIETAIDLMRKARNQGPETNKQGSDSAKTKHAGVISKRRQEFQTKKIKLTEPHHTLMLNAVSNTRQEKLQNVPVQQSTDEPTMKDVLPPWVYTDFRTPPKFVDAKVQTKKEQLQLIKARIGQPVAPRQKYAGVSQDKAVNASLSPDIRKPKDSVSRIQIMSKEYENNPKNSVAGELQETQDNEREFLLRCSSVNHEGKLSSISLLKHSSTRNLPYYNQEFVTSTVELKHPKHLEPMDDAMKDRILIGRRVKQTHSYMLIDDVSRTKPTTREVVFIKGAGLKADQIAKLIPQLEKRNSGVFESKADHEGTNIKSRRITSRDADPLMVSRSHLLDSRLRNMAKLSMRNQHQSGLYSTYEDAATLEQDFVIEENLVSSAVETSPETQGVLAGPRHLGRIRNAGGAFQVTKNSNKASSLLTNLVHMPAKSSKKLLLAASGSVGPQKKGPAGNKDGVSKKAITTGYESAYDIFLLLAGFCQGRATTQSQLGENVDSGAVVPTGIKCFVGEGNNQKLVINILKEHARVELESFVARSMFSWTQKSVPNFKPLKGSKLPQSIKRVSWAEGSANLSAYGLDNTNIMQVVETLIDQSVTNEGVNHQQNNRLKLFSIDHRIEMDLIELLSSTKEKSGLLSIEKPEFVVANHIRGLKFICRKVMLAQTIINFAKQEGSDPWDVIPVTYLVRGDTFDKDIEELIETKRKDGQLAADNTFQIPLIIKPGEFSNRGIGIGMSFDTTELKEVASSILEQRKSTSWVIVQDYLAQPLLFKNRKFDLRCYGLVIKLVDRVLYFWYKQGYARTSSFEYDPDEKKNLKVHLTNEAVQVRGRQTHLTQTPKGSACSSPATRFTTRIWTSTSKKILLSKIPRQASSKTSCHK